jgi:(p)ppGpp synthase/HD superfamily hydrolase
MEWRNWEADMDIIKKAVNLAWAAHSGQFRKYSHSHDPYVFHPMRVAGLVMMGNPDRVKEGIVAAAWLHDILEDSNLSSQHLIDEGIPSNVVGWVKELTRPRNDRRKREVRVNEMIEKMRKASFPARLIKLADRADNLDDLATDPSVPVDFALQYANEGRRLAEAMLGTDAFLEARIAILVSKIEHERR